MIINVKYKIGSFVYVITDPEQNARMITGFTVRKNGIYYLVSFVDCERQFEEFELSEEKSFR